MAFPSLLSEHEHKAFSAFLGQLAEEERSKPHNQPGAQPPLAGHEYPHQQQHQHQDRPSPQSHLQLNPILSSQHDPNSPSRIRSMPSDLPLSMTQQQQHQQHEWTTQQASANRLLAPGGVLDPQAMSQAFLQNPELMAQASAISQAMVLAQQQQQQQQQQQHQMQLQIQAQEQMAHQQHNSNPNFHLHETRSQDLHPQPHHYQQPQQQQHPSSELYPQYQQQQNPPSFQNGYSDPSMPMGFDPSFETGSGPTRTVRKRKSQTSLHGAHTSQSSGTPPPLPSNTGAIHHSTSSTYVSTSPSGYHESEHAAYLERAESTPPSKKPARRKGSSANDYSYASSSPGYKAGQRSSHDGHDSGHSAGSGGGARRKTSEASFYVVTSRTSRDGSEEMGHGGDHINYQHPHPHPHHHNGYYSNGINMNYKTGQIMEGDEAMLLKHSNHNRHPYSDDQEDPSRALSPQQNNSLNQMQPRGPGKKQPHELLTDAEKKANHIASEQKRRQNIRIGFDSLVEIVPTLSECQRSEALILQKSVDYIQRLLDQKNELKNRVRDLQVNLGESADGDESASEMEFEE